MSRSPAYLRLTLLSSACFMGSHSALDEDLDACQELDALGLPQVGGKTLKGLLVEALAQVFDLPVLKEALAQTSAGPDRSATDTALAWHRAALRLFGTTGSPPVGWDGAPGSSQLWIGDARIPAAERAGLEGRRPDPALRRLATLAHTELRGQTRIEPSTGAALPQSLRLARLARAGLVFEAPLGFNGRSLPTPPALEGALLALAALGVRRGGLHRARGWGRLELRLVVDGSDVTTRWSAELLSWLEKIDERNTS